MYIPFELVDYVCTYYFRGNQTEFAHELGIELRTVRRAIGSLKQGRESHSVLSATLEFFVAHSGEWDVFLKSLAQRGVPLANEGCMFRDVMTGTRAALRNQKRSSANDRRFQRFTMAAQELAREMETAFCGNNNEHHVGCKRFVSKEAGPGQQSIDPDQMPCMILRKLIQCAEEAAIYDENDVEHDVE